jgi:hypothetical protein
MPGANIVGWLEPKEEMEERMILLWFNSARNNQSFDATLMTPVRVDSPFQPSQPPRIRCVLGMVGARMDA